MILRGEYLKTNSSNGSGRVRRFVLPDGKVRITQITTFCPDFVGPGATHLYLIEDDAVILLDTGIPTEIAKSIFYRWRFQPIPPEIEALPPDYSERQLSEGLELAGFTYKDIDFLVISHGHPDHFLMGPHILDKGDPKVVAHLFDTAQICNPWQMLNTWLSRRSTLMSTGMPPPLFANRDAIQTAGLKAFALSLRVDEPHIWDGPLVVNGAQVGEIGVTHLPGHSNGSLGLIVGQQSAGGVLLCGDVLLSPITPSPDDLLVYLRTLNKLKRLDNVSIALPAHGKSIGNLQARIDFLQRHHRRRLLLTFEACEGPRSAWEVATIPRYFNVHVDPSQFNPLAGQESVVHMELLLMAGGLFRSHIRDGVHYFKNSGEPFDDVYERITALVGEQSVMPIMRY